MRNSELRDDFKRRRIDSMVDEDNAFNLFYDRIDLGVSIGIWTIILLVIIWVLSWP